MVFVIGYITKYNSLNEKLLGILETLKSFRNALHILPSLCYYLFNLSKKDTHVRKNFA